MQNSIQKSRGIKSAGCFRAPGAGVPGRGEEFLRGDSRLKVRYWQIIKQTNIRQVSKMQRPKITAPQLKRTVCQQARCGSIIIFEQRLSRASRAPGSTGS